MYSRIILSHARLAALECTEKFIRSKIKRRQGEIICSMLGIFYS